MENIAKSTSYGCYLDCDFETAKYPDDKTHIVGLLAEYVYDLEQRILHYDERYIKLWNEIETLRECVSKEFDQEQKISDLEAKLAESEEEHELLIDQFEEETEKLRKQIKQESDARKRFVEEVKELKQQLHDLPKKIVGEIRDVAGDYWEECGNVPDLNTLTMEDFDEILDAILKKFGGEDE